MTSWWRPGAARGLKALEDGDDQQDWGEDAGLFGDDLQEEVLKLKAELPEVSQAELEWQAAQLAAAVSGGREPSGGAPDGSEQGPSAAQDWKEPREDVCEERAGDVVGGTGDDLAIPEVGVSNCGTDRESSIAPTAGLDPGASNSQNLGGTKSRIGDDDVQPTSAIQVDKDTVQVGVGGDKGLRTAWQESTHVPEDSLHSQEYVAGRPSGALHVAVPHTQDLGQSMRSSSTVEGDTGQHGNEDPELNFPGGNKGEGTPPEHNREEVSGAWMDDLAGWRRELEDAEMSTRLLVSSPQGETKGQGVLERLSERLASAQDDWNPCGRPDSQGGMIGGSVAVRVSTVGDVLHQAFQSSRHITPRALAKCIHRTSGAYTAVGTSQGSVLVHMTPVPIPPQQPSSELFELSEGVKNEVTALGFSHSGDRDKVFLAVGHSNGHLVVWDVGARKTVVIVTGHVSPITCCAFLPNVGGTPSTLLSADTAGRLLYHSLTSWLVRTSVSTRTVLEGDLGIAVVQPMAPFSLPVRAPEKEDVGAKYIREDVRMVAGEGIICLCCPGRCEVGRFVAEGKLVMLYRIPAPVDSDKQCVPCVAWAPLSAAARNRVVEEGLPSTTLAVAWGRSVSLVEVPLVVDKPRWGEGSQVESARWGRRLSRTDPSEASSLQQQAQKHPMKTTATWDASGEGGLELSPGNRIMAVHWFDAQHLAILREQNIMSQLIVFDPELKPVEQVEIDDRPVPLQADEESRDVGLCLGSVAGVGTRLTIAGYSGLKAMRLMGWQERLDVLRDIAKWKMALHLGLQLYVQALRAQPQNVSFGHSVAASKDLKDLSQRLSQLLLGFVDNALQPIGQTGSSGGVEEQKDLRGVVDAAHVAVELCILLKAEQALFQEIFPRFLAAAASTVFLEVLEPAIVRNELSGAIAPEVVQALVEQFSEKKQPHTVERCVLHMDIASLDLNQVIRLCLQHHLFTALLYIFNQSLLQDCITPAMHLLNAVAQEVRPVERRAYTLKLLVYMRCCLRGDKYPPTSGSLPLDLAETVKHKTLGFILFTRSEELAAVGDSMGTGVRADRPDERDMVDCVGQMVFKDPHPVLRCLLAVNAPATMFLLEDTLKEWDCVEKDLLETWSGQTYEEMVSVRSVTQVVIDALIELMESDLTPKYSTGETATEDECVVIEYICKCVGSGRAIVSGSMVITLLEYLAIRVQQDAASKKGTEDVFVSIVRMTQRTVLDQPQVRQALGLASQAGMLQASALLHHVSGDFRLALKSHIQDNKDPGSAFKYVDAAMEDAKSDPRVSERLKTAILSCVEDMASLDAEAAARMVLKWFPHDHQAVIQGLQQTRPLLFRYLRSAMEAALVQGVQGDSDQPAVDVSRLLTKDNCTMYLGLLCEFEPSSVWPFLQAHDHLVDVDQCKQWCQRYGLLEGAAHLLEREGDISGALDMHLKRVESCNRKLEEAIWSGAMPLDFGSQPLSKAHSGFFTTGRAGPSSPTSGRATGLRTAPVEAVRAREALHAAIALCQRNSRQLNVERRAGRGGVDMLRLWFLLLKVFVDCVRQVSQGASPLQTRRSSGVASTASATPVCQRALHTITHHELRSAAAMSTALAGRGKKVVLLHDLYTAFMEDVISAMADYVPLRDIMELIVVHHSHERFGDFRGTLLGLMSAYNYERNILNSVSQLMNSDAYRALLSCYRRHVRALDGHLRERPRGLADGEEPGQEGRESSDEESDEEGGDVREPWTTRGAVPLGMGRMDKLCLAPGGRPVSVGLGRGRLGGAGPRGVALGRRR